MPSIQQKVTTPVSCYLQLLADTSPAKPGVPSDTQVAFDAYVGDEDNASISMTSSFSELLADMIAAHSIPSNPPSTKNVYKQELMNALQALKSDIDIAIDNLNKMPNIDDVNTSSSQPKQVKAVKKANKPK